MSQPAKPSAHGAGSGLAGPGPLNPWFAVIGNGADGREDAMFAIARDLEARGLRIAGLIEARVPLANEAFGVDMLEAGGAGRAPLARPSDTPDQCDLGFLEAGLDTAARWALAPDRDVVFLHVGRLESARRGLWPLVERALAGPPRRVVIAARPSVLAPIALALPDPADALELPAPAEARRAFVDRILEAETFSQANLRDAIATR